jgi:hypothetical protein
MKRRPLSVRSTRKSTTRRSIVHCHCSIRLASPEIITAILRLPSVAHFPSLSIEPTHSTSCFIMTANSNTENEGLEDVTLAELPYGDEDEDAHPLNQAGSIANKFSLIITGIILVCAARFSATAVSVELPLRPKGLSLTTSCVKGI